MYIPTIDGKPARFDEEQLCFCSRSFAVRPVASRRTVNRQIARTLAFRRERGYAEPQERKRYSCVPVEVPK